MKGLKGISRDDLVETMRLFAQDKGGQHDDFDRDKQLRQKYPVYDEVFQMVLTAAKTGEELALTHALGMQSTFRILVHVAEGK